MIRELCFEDGGRAASQESGCHQSMKTPGKWVLSLGPPEGTTPASETVSDFWPPGCRRMNLCFKPPGLWQFVTAGPGK